MIIQVFFKKYSIWFQNFFYSYPAVSLILVFFNKILESEESLNRTQYVELMVNLGLFGLFEERMKDTSEENKPEYLRVISHYKRYSKTFFEKEDLSSSDD